MREHCQIGYDMLTASLFSATPRRSCWPPGVFDGSGYPRGLKASKSSGARIFTIADSLDAMISDRPYRRALPMSHAREEIRRCSGSQLIPSRRRLYVHPEQHWLELRENSALPSVLPI